MVTKGFSSPENGSRFCEYEMENSAPTASVETTVRRKRISGVQMGRRRGFRRTSCAIGGY